MSLESLVANAPVEDLDRWTHSLRQLLKSERGRSGFRWFLQTREFDEEEKALSFWEECNALLSNSEIHIPDPDGLVSRADDVDLDLSGIVEAVNSGNQHKIRKILKRAKQSAKESLEDYYGLFRTQLLKLIERKKKPIVENSCL